MNIAEIKDYVERHLVAAEKTLQDDFSRVVAYVTGEEQRIKTLIETEIADLRARGYTVSDPITYVTPAA